MTATRDLWVRCLFASLCITAAPLGLPVAHAQGWGPDPYRPFNAQYDQYAYPIAPETGGAARDPVGIGRRDNQMQQYYDELEGASRLSSQRYGIGLQYWKVRSDEKRDIRERLIRRTARNSDEVLGSITQKYLAYFSEDNPRKRAILLRNFDPSRFAENREALGRRGNFDDDNERVPPLESVRRGRREVGGTSGAGARSGAASTLRRSTEMNEENSSRDIPPAPPVPGLSRETSPARRKPSDVLDRSRRVGETRRDSATPGAGNRPNRKPADPSSPED